VERTVEELRMRGSIREAIESIGKQTGKRIRGLSPVKGRSSSPRKRRSLADAFPDILIGPKKLRGD